MKKLYFVGYKGISVPSQLIKWFTRGEYSHISIYHPEVNKQMEQWPHTGDFTTAYFDYSDMSVHTPGTPFEVWSIAVTEAEYEYCMEYWQLAADRKEKYDWRGVMDFMIKGDENAEGRSFCSEIAIKPQVLWNAWTTVDANTVDPSKFIMLMQVRGAQLAHVGQVQANVNLADILPEV